MLVVAGLVVAVVVVGAVTALLVWRASLEPSRGEATELVALHEPDLTDIVVGEVVSDGSRGWEFTGTARLAAGRYEGVNPPDAAARCGTDYLDFASVLRGRGIVQPAQPAGAAVTFRFITTSVDEADGDEPPGEVSPSGLTAGGWRNDVLAEGDRVAPLREHQVGGDTLVLRGDADWAAMCAELRVPGR